LCAKQSAPKCAGSFDKQHPGYFQNIVALFADEVYVCPSPLFYF
jgi:hypothetical protein